MARKYLEEIGIDMDETPWGDNYYINSKRGERWQKERNIYVPTIRQSTIYEGLAYAGSCCADRIWCSAFYRADW